MFIDSYHYEFLHTTVHEVSHALCHGLSHSILDLKLHIHVSVVKQVEEPEPLSIQFLDRRRIPPVLVELPIRVHCQLGQSIREGLEKEED